MRSPATCLAFFLAVASSTATALVERSARATISRAAARQPPPVAALLCCVATAMIPLALGATHTASAITDAGKNLGLEAHREQKLYSTGEGEGEGAAGGDGAAAGGGCACQ